MVAFLVDVSVFRWSSTLEKRRALQLFEEHRGLAVGGWTIVEYVGHGGSAVVLKSVRDDTTAALKIIDQEIVDKFGRDEQIERVNRERRLIGHNHPNLIQIYDAGVCDRTDFLFVAMELHNGTTLTDVVPDFPIENIGLTISQIAGAAQYLEQLELVHRDIKPDNVVVAEDFSKATLLDLGVLRPISDLDDDITTATAFLGTTRYSSPEYLLREGEEESLEGWRALTYYQLGGLLHDMIMHKRLFDDIDAPPPRLTDAVRYTTPVVEASDVSPHYVGLARSCLQKDWKLRLKLVSWHSFSQTPAEAVSEVTELEVAARIAERAPLGRAAAASQATGSRRLALQRVRTGISTLLAQQCTEADLFPPIRIDGIDDTNKDATEVVLQTGPSPSHALPSLLVVKFRITVLDFRSMHIQVAGFAATDVLDFESTGKGVSRVFVGELTAEDLGSALRQFTVRALDAAQRQVLFGGSSVLVVNSKDQSC